jgi:hypothetical protein
MLRFAGATEFAHPTRTARSICVRPSLSIERYGSPAQPDRATSSVEIVWAD